MFELYKKVRGTRSQKYIKKYFHLPSSVGLGIDSWGQRWDSWPAGHPAAITPYQDVSILSERQTKYPVQNTDVILTKHAVYSVHMWPKA